MDDISVAGVHRDQAVAACETNVNFFSMLCIPDVFRFPFPPIFLAIWQMLVDGVRARDKQIRLAIGLPRGFGKTIFLKLFVVWCVLFTDRKFILIVCNTARLAENFLADVETILSSVNILRVFGDWRISNEVDRQDLKKFTFKGRGITLAALGAGSSLRGLNIKFERPDVILMDDMQSREEAESEVESAKMLSWMLGTLLKANNKLRCLFVFVGNMYPFEGSILRKLQTNAAWTTFITGALLEDGQSIWPELRSVESLLEELENDESMGHPEIFYSEVMNDPEAGSKAQLDFTKINVWNFPEDGPSAAIHAAGFVVIDPSAAKNKRSDDVAIGAFLVFEGEPVLWDLAVGKFNPMDQCRKSIELACRYNLPMIVVEDVAYQSTLMFWMEQIKNQLGLNGAFQIGPINPKGRQKVSRILDMFKQLTASRERVWVHPRVLSQVKHQIIYFNPLKPTQNKDDVLDLLAYAYQIIMTFGASLLCALDLRMQETSSSFSEDLQLEF